MKSAPLLSGCKIKSIFHTWARAPFPVAFLTRLASLYPGRGQSSHTGLHSALQMSQPLNLCSDYFPCASCSFLLLACEILSGPAASNWFLLPWVPGAMASFPCAVPSPRPTQEWVLVTPDPCRAFQGVWHGKCYLLLLYWKRCQTFKKWI